MAYLIFLAEDRRWKLRLCYYNDDYEESNEVDEWRGVYSNDYDGDLEKECENAKHIARIKSVDDQGGKNDRTWWFGCQKGDLGGEYKFIIFSLQNLQRLLFD